MIAASRPPDLSSLDVNACTVRRARAIPLSVYFRSKAGSRYGLINSGLYLSYTYVCMRLTTAAQCQAGRPSCPKHNRQEWKRFFYEHPEVIRYQVSHASEIPHRDGAVSGSSSLLSEACLVFRFTA